MIRSTPTVWTPSALKSSSADARSRSLAEARRSACAGTVVLTGWSSCQTGLSIVRSYGGFARCGGDGDPVRVEGHVVLDVSDGRKGVVVKPDGSSQIGPVPVDDVVVGGLALVGAVGVAIAASQHALVDVVERN